MIKQVVILTTAAITISVSTFMAVVPVIERQSNEVHMANAELKELREKLALEKKANKLRATHMVRVTAYTPRKEECDSTPNTTALNRRSRPGYSAAVGPDLMFLLGQKVLVKGVGVRHITDTKPKNGLDVMVGTVKEAKKIGSSIKQISVIGG